MTSEEFKAINKTLNMLQKTFLSPTGTVLTWTQLEEEEEQYDDTFYNDDEWVTPPPPIDPCGSYRVLIPVEFLERLRLAAVARDIPVSQLIREWVIELLEVGYE